MLRHANAVTAIAAQVAHFNKARKPFRIYHGSTNSTRPAQFRVDETIDASQLSHVLAINTTTKTALVEPNVPMDRLVQTTLTHGLIPPVVMEFPGITAGGGFSGTSGESSSFKYGFFEDTVNWVEIVLGTGEVVSASKTINADLFHGAASGFGTMGVITLLELRLIDSKPCVALTYHRVGSVREAIQKLEEVTSDENDYVDGILFAPDRGVICVGRLIDIPDDGVRIQQFSRATDPWFYLHASDVISKSKQPWTEAIPIVDYLFRYDRGGFWVGSFAFKYFMCPFNRFTRWVLDRFLHTRAMYHALHQSGLSQRYVIQDVGIPYSAAEEFIKYLDESFGYYPLWLCPLRRDPGSKKSTFSDFVAHGESSGPQTLLNIGIWGMGSTQLDKFVEINRNLEDKVREFKGKKWLYAHTYYTEEEFWRIYDRKAYDSLRATYGASYLPNVYDKVGVSLRISTGQSWMTWVSRVFWGIWPLRGLYGLFHAAMGGDYLLQRASGRKRNSSDSRKV